MREKELSCICVCIFILTSIPIVNSNETNDMVTIEQGKPDLVGKVEVVEINDRYYFKHTITNIGTATAYGWGINTTVYDFGGCFMKRLGFDFTRFLPYWTAWFIAEFLHINLLFVLKSTSKNFPPEAALEPNESYSHTGFNLPNQDSFLNAQIGLVIECIVDEYNWCNESNENNNKEVYRWWRPYDTEPPFF